MNTKFKKGHIPWNKGKDCPKLKGENNGQWNGGVKKSVYGYVEIYSPSHPHRHRRDNYVRRNRLVMEEYLGRYLKSNEQVHHKNGIKDDDRIENLELMTIEEHSRFHAKGMKERCKRFIKFELLEFPPEKVIKDKIFCIGNRTRQYIGSKCAYCKRLFWTRRDGHARFCSQSCNKLYQ